MTACVVRGAPGDVVFDDSWSGGCGWGGGGGGGAREEGWRREAREDVGVCGAKVV